MKRFLKILLKVLMGHRREIRHVSNSVVDRESTLNTFKQVLAEDELARLQKIISLDAFPPIDSNTAKVISLLQRSDYEGIRALCDDQFYILESFSAGICTVYLADFAPSESRILLIEAGVPSLLVHSVVVNDLDLNAFPTWMEMFNREA